MTFGQILEFFERQIRIPRQILPLYMCFYKVFWEKIEFLKKFEFSFEGKKVSAASGIEPAPYGLTANNLPLCYAVADFLKYSHFTDSNFSSLPLYNPFHRELKKVGYCIAKW